MFEKMDLALINAKMRMDDYMDRFAQEEKGAADIVAILVVIVIVLGIMSVFRGKLQELIGTVFDKATRELG